VWTIGCPGVCRNVKLETAPGRYWRAKLQSRETEL
jgi:hypothetical protein